MESAGSAWGRYVSVGYARIVRERADATTGTFWIFAASSGFLRGVNRRIRPLRKGTLRRQQRTCLERFRTQARTVGAVALRFDASRVGVREVAAEILPPGPPAAPVLQAKAPPRVEEVAEPARPTVIAPTEEARQVWQEWSDRSTGATSPIRLVVSGKANPGRKQHQRQRRQ